ncbi:MAG TPA: hypothetical protein VFQ45_17820 [Longimicrobium sp.]|nr:hypothetical protein [Longimicrobium sp.]
MGADELRALGAEVRGDLDAWAGDALAGWLAPEVFDHADELAELAALEAALEPLAEAEDEVAELEAWLTSGFYPDVAAPALTTLTTIDPVSPRTDSPSPAPRRQPRRADGPRAGRWDGMPPERFSPAPREYGDGRAVERERGDAPLPSRGGRRGIGSLADLAGAIGNGGAAWPAADAEPGSFARWDDHFGPDDPDGQEQPDVPRAPEPTRAPGHVLPDPDDEEPPREKEPAGLDFPARARADAAWEAPRPTRGAVRGLGDLAALAGSGGLDLAAPGADARAERDWTHAETQRTQREGAEDPRGGPAEARERGGWAADRGESAAAREWEARRESAGREVDWAPAALTRRERGAAGIAPDGEAGRRGWAVEGERPGVPVGWIYPPQPAGNGSAFPFTDPPASSSRAEAAVPRPEDRPHGEYGAPLLETVPARTHAELRGLRGRMRDTAAPAIAPADPQDAGPFAEPVAAPRGQSAAAILAAVGQVRARDAAAAPAASPARDSTGPAASAATAGEAAARRGPPLLEIEVEARSESPAAVPGIDVDELMDALSREIGREYRRYYGS